MERIHTCVCRHIAHSPRPPALINSLAACLYMLMARAAAFPNWLRLMRTRACELHYVTQRYPIVIDHSPQRHNCSTPSMCVCLSARLVLIIMFILSSTSGNCFAHHVRTLIPITYQLVQPSCSHTKQHAPSKHRMPKSYNNTLPPFIQSKHARHITGCQFGNHAAICK